MGPLCPYCRHAARVYEGSVACVRHGDVEYRGRCVDFELDVVAE